MFASKSSFASAIAPETGIRRHGAQFIAMPSFLVWSDWQPLALPETPTPAVLAEVLDGGQAFRWARTPDGVWQGGWSDCVARLKPSEQGGLWKISTLRFRLRELDF